MESEDLYPNQSEYFLPREPLDQEMARKKESAKTLEALDVLRLVLEHLDRRIEFYGSVDAMPDAVKTDVAAFLSMHNANQLTRDNLKSEKEYIESLLDNPRSSSI